MLPAQSKALLSFSFPATPVRAFYLAVLEVIRAVATVGLTGMAEIRQRADGGAPKEADPPATALLTGLRIGPQRIVGGAMVVNLPTTVAREVLDRVAEAWAVNSLMGGARERLEVVQAELAAVLVTQVAWEAAEELVLAEGVRAVVARVTAERVPTNAEKEPVDA